MHEPQFEPLEERIRRLEARVEELQRVVSRQAPAPRPAAPHPAPRAAAAPRGVGFDFRMDSQHWLNKVGIGLVLFGVAFLFKYSIEQGWLTEWVRVGLGLVLAAVLLGAGIALYTRQRRFSQVLLGGGVGTLYITGFAAYQLYGLVSYPLAFAFMLLVTAATFLLSLRQDEPVLALVGALGAFGTPFLLHPREGSVLGLVGYACILVAGTSGLYLFRGWRALLWTASAGGWAVLFLALDGASPGAGMERAVVQAGVVIAWTAFWALPLLHAVHRLRPGAAGWGGGALQRLLGWDDGRLTRVHLHLLSVTTPLTALTLMQALWRWSPEAWGGWMIGLAAVHAVAAALLARRRPPLAHTQLSAGAILLSSGTLLVLDGNPLYLALAAQAALIHLLARRLPGRALSGQAHLLFFALSVWLAVRLFDGSAEAPVLVNARALADLALIGLLLAAALLLPRRADAMAYRLVAHLALLGWWWRELGSLPSGEGYVTIVWGLYGAALLLVGLRRDVQPLQSTALATLLLPVAKLFLVDLHALAVPWRILLFLGFGGAFLLLSYSLQVWWRPGVPGRR